MSQSKGYGPGGNADDIPGVNVTGDVPAGEPVLFGRQAECAILDRLVTGARAGRGVYDKIVGYGQQVATHPKVQQAAGAAQSKATELAKTAAAKAPGYAKSAASSAGSMASSAAKTASCDSPTTTCSWSTCRTGDFPYSRSSMTWSTARG